MMGGGWNGGGAWGLAGDLLSLVLLAALLIGVMLVVRALLGSPWRSSEQRPCEPPPAPRASEPPSSFRILEERYARGEMDRQEFPECKDYFQT